MSGARFTVTKTGGEDQPITDATGGYGSVPPSGIQFAPHSGKDYAVVY
ncbi:unnamed protein product, partial [Candidula unifasciata]